MTPNLNLSHVKLTPQHLERKAVIYIRQSSPKQVREHLDSQLTQRTLVKRAQNLGWHAERIDVLDGDLGHSAAHAQGADGVLGLLAGDRPGQPWLLDRLSQAPRLQDDLLHSRGL